MKTAYEVTIGIPVYNIERYVRRMMESVMAQTFGDIEFLILDDCGTDSSLAIVREYQQQHPRGGDVRIVSQPRNMGQGRGRNRIIDEARGRYLYFLDGDDSIEPNTIEVLHAALKRHGAEIAYASHRRIEQFGTQDDKVVEWRFEPRYFTEPDEFATYAYHTYGTMPANTWNFLIDIEVYRRNNIRYKDVNFWEDFSTTIDLPTYVQRVVLLPDVTYNYYCRYGTLSNFQQRKSIAKGEIQRTIAAMQQVKEACGRLRGKSYFPARMQKVMMTHFYMACAILHDCAIITPPFTRQEISRLMASPLTLGEICRFRSRRIPNLLLYLLGVLPPVLSVAIIALAGRRKGLI